MIEHLIHHVIPAAYALLPPAMASRRATAMLIAIALQESRLTERRQLHGGPARGFWQFERIGIKGVLLHRKSQPPIEAVLATLCYPKDAEGAYEAVEHNDVLAASFARCLLWTLPEALPAREDTRLGWQQYLAAWRPGKPHPATWDALYQQAWTLAEPF
jgi:hypothetical protein